MQNQYSLPMYLHIYKSVQNQYFKNKTGGTYFT